MFVEINQWKSIRTFLDTYVDEIKRNTPKFTGDLAQSISGEYVADGNNISISISANDYFNFVNEGVNGTENNYGSRFSYRDKKPPIGSITPYAKALGVSPYALATSIYKKGIRPKNIIDEITLSNALDKLSQDMLEDIWDVFYEKNNNK